MAYEIAYLVGSVDPDSLNLRLARALVLAAPKDLSFVEVPISDLPFYYPGFDDEPTPAGQAVREIVRGADGVILVTPEYNRSMPAVLKNAIDWLSRPKGKSAFAGKPTLIAGASGGAIGTAVAQAQLRSLVPMLGGYLMGTPELYLQVKKTDFAADGAATTPGTQEFLEKAMRKYAGFVERIRGA